MWLGEPKPLDEEYLQDLEVMVRQEREARESMFHMCGLGLYVHCWEEAFGSVGCLESIILG